MPLRRHDRGASAVEYALLAAGIGVLSIGGMMALRETVGEHNRCVAAGMGVIDPPVTREECPNADPANYPDP